MKTLIPTSYISFDPHDVRELYRDDIDRLVQVASQHGYRLSFNHAAEIWTRHSEDYCASWLMMGGSDDGLLPILLRYTQVFESPETDVPRPPEGYATWLDYAVSTMDTRTPSLLQAFAETKYQYSREDMQRAAQSELLALRKIAGFTD